MRVEVFWSERPVQKSLTMVLQERSEGPLAFPPNTLLKKDFTAGLTLDMTFSRPKSCSQSCLHVMHIGDEFVGRNSYVLQQSGRR